MQLSVVVNILVAAGCIPIHKLALHLTVGHESTENTCVLTRKGPDYEQTQTDSWCRNTGKVMWDQVSYKATKLESALCPAFI